MLALNSMVSRAAYATPNLSSLILFGSVSTTCSFTDSVAVAMVENQFMEVLGWYKYLLLGMSVYRHQYRSEGR